MKNVTITGEEAAMLSCYILMTTNYRKGEAEAWENLSKEVKEDGSPAFPVAHKNANYYRDLETRLTALCNKLDNLRVEY